MTSNDHIWLSVASSNRGCQMVYFHTKIQIWVNFVVPCNERCWYILWPIGIYFSHFVYILWPFGNLVLTWYTFPRFGIFCQQKIWQPWSSSAIYDRPQQYALHDSVWADGLKNSATWLRGAMVIENASELEDRGFESPPGCKLFLFPCTYERQLTPIHVIITL
jgi:hypothetical protein